MISDPSLWLTVVLAALISLFAIYVAVSPLLQEGRATRVLEDDKVVELLGRRDVVMQAIKELEFDYRVGKISQEDFQRFDQRLRRQAIGLLQQLDKFAPASESLDEQLESMIAQFRQTIPAPPHPHPRTAPSASAVATARQSARFCTECGKPVAAGYKFCAHCGASIVQMDLA